MGPLDPDIWSKCGVWNLTCLCIDLRHDICRLEDAEAILDEAIPELTNLRSQNSQLEEQVGRHTDSLRACSLTECLL
jgi:hypothetical protein